MKQRTIWLSGLLMLLCAVSVNAQSIGPNTNGNAGSGGAPTFTLTADENIPAGTAVSVDAAGHAVVHWGPVPNIGGLVSLFGGSSNLANHQVAALVLSSSSAVVFSSLGAQPLTVSGNTLSVGTLETSSISKQAILVSHGPRTGFVQAVALSATTFLLGYNDSVTGDCNLVVGSISGGVISYGTPVQVIADALAANAGFGLVAISSTTFIAAIDGTNVGTYVVRAGSVSGTTITLGSAVNVSTNSFNGQAICELSSTKFVVAYADGSNSNDATFVVASLSGLSVTLGTPVAATFANPSWFYLQALSSSAFYLSSSADPLQDLAAIAGTVSGTTITLGTAVRSGVTVYQQHWSAPMGSGVLEQGLLNAAPTLVSISGTTITLGTIQGINHGNLYKVNGFMASGPTLGGYPDLNGPVAVLSSTLAVFSDSDFAIYGLDNNADISPEVQHQFLTGYWLYPLDSTHALVTLLNFNGTSSARVVTMTAMNLTPPIGVTAAGASSGQPVIVQNAGKLSGLSGLTPGATYYANGDGSLVTANTGQSVGTALSATDLAIAPH